MPRRRNHLRAIGVLTAVAVTGLSACATGDGTTLRPPAPGQTVPPTAPPTTAEGETLPSESVSTLPIDPALQGGTVAVPSAADGFTGATAWTEGDVIGTRHTCDGLDVAPPVSWSTPPLDTEEIAIVLVDESTPGREFVHWVLGGLDPAINQLAGAQVPEGAVQGLNHFGNVWYDGPCPPPGSTHTYRLEVHPLSEPLGMADGTPASDMLTEIERIGLGPATITATYGR